jgi:sugar/nucleoside kinase (ribokinase family)
MCGGMRLNGGESPRIASVGVLTLDWLDAGVGREGPFPAGNALYAAVGAWLAGARPTIVAHAGSDYPTRPLEDLGHQGLSCASVRRVPGHSYRMLLRDRPWGREVECLEGSGEASLLDAVVDDLPFEPLDGVSVGPGRPAQQRQLLEAARARGCHSTLDLLFVRNLEKPTPQQVLELLSCTDAFLPSVLELHQLWPDTPLSMLLPRLHEAGCRTVVLKMGSLGCVASDGEQVLFLPAISTSPVDATGAGDAFCGAFQADWIRNRDLSTAICWGAAASSIVIEGYGALHAATEGGRRRALQRAGQARPTRLTREQLGVFRSKPGRLGATASP